MPNFNTLAENWNIYTYPWRPNQEYINFLKKYISSHSKVCILGSTIEYRELCRDLGCACVDIYDISPEMLHKDGLLSNKETLYLQSWESIAGAYDIILGDLIFFLLPKENQKILYSNLQVLLKVGGVFIARHAYNNANIVSFPKKELLDITNDIVLFNHLSFYGFITNLSTQNIIQTYFLEKYDSFQKSNFQKFIPYSNNEKTFSCYGKDFSKEGYIKTIGSVNEVGLVYQN